MEPLKEIDYSIISELFKNSKLSDRMLAKKIGVSPPTVTRRRAFLEKELLLNYTVIPDFGRLGFEVLAFTFARWNYEVSQAERIPQALAFLSEHPDILFVSTGQGLSSDRVCISIHKRYSDYANLMSELRAKWKKYFTILDSFIVSLRGDNILRQITFRHLGELLKQHTR
jgi:DNA-binding Lrp family transcriptional regulator